MKEVAYGITEKFDMPSELIAWGEIRGKGSNLCIDSMGHKGIFGLFFMLKFTNKILTPNLAGGLCEDHKPWDPFYWNQIFWKFSPDIPKT